MDSEFIEKGIILRTGTFREIDVWVRIFFPSQGIVTAMAFGGRRSRRRFCGCLDVLNYVLCSVKISRKGYIILEEASLLDGFKILKKDLRRLGMVSNCIKFCESILEGGDRESFELLHGSLVALEKSQQVSPYFPMLFRAWLTFSQGYQPSFDRCGNCGRKIHDRQACSFKISEGSLTCRVCDYQITERCVPLDGTTALFLHKLRSTSPQEWICWQPDQKLRQQCAGLVDAFVDWHLAG